MTALRANWAGQAQAMTDGDAAALGELLTGDFSLRHVTGYEQSRAEWLDDVASGAMTYHRLQVVGVTTDTGSPRSDRAQVAGGSTAPLLFARTHTTATIWGSHGTWPLQLQVTFTHAGTHWLAQRTVASTWR